MNRKIWIARVVVFVVLGLMGATAVLAQLPTGTILGNVKDASGAVVPGATVTARNTDTNEARTAVTDDSGTYRLNALPVGNYELSVEQTGFKKSIRSGIKLTVTQEASVDFALEVGSVSQQVEVTAEAVAPVNTTTSSLGGTVDEQQMNDLPLNGRDYIQLALLQAGTTEDRARTPSSTVLAGQGTWFSSNGAPVRANAYLLDGTSLSTYGGGSGASIGGNTLGLGGVREFRIVTNSFDAEYGMVMGSQMAMVSRSGTNSFHGDVFDYLRNDVLDARNYFDTNASAGLTASGAQRRLPPFRRNNFGGSFGGPIQKDKMFFYVTYEGLRQLQGLTFLNNTIPNGCRGAAGATITSANCSLLTAGASATVDPRVAPWIPLYPSPNQGVNGLSWSFAQPNQEDYGQVRIDRSLSSADNLFGRYTADNADLTNPGAYPGFPFISSGRNQYLTVAENHIFTPALLNTARFSFSRTTQLIGVLSYNTGPGFSFEPGSPMGGLSIGGVTAIAPGGTATSQAVQNVYSWSDDLFYVKGRHSLKFGTLINRYQLFVANGVNLYGSIKFSNYLKFLQASPTTLSGIQAGGSNSRDVRYNTLGWYAQDDIRATKRLMLNLGLRYEFNTDIHAIGPSALINGAIENPLLDVNFTHTDLLTRNPSYHNFGPRLGFAWDVFGDGKTSVRGGFGLLYNIAGWLAFLHGATRAPFGQNQFTVQNAPNSGPNTWTVPFAVPTGTSLASLQARSPAAYDWNMRQSHMLEYNLAIQRQLPWRTVLTLAYGGSRGYNLQVLSDANPTVPNGIPSVTGGIESCIVGTPPPINQQDLVDGQANTCVFNSATGVTPVVAPQRQNNNWGPFNGIQDSRDSWYNSLQVEFQKSVAHGLQFQTNFTWSKLLDDTQGATSGGTEVVGSSTYASDPWNPMVDKGPASFNTPFVWKTNVVYHFPAFKVSNGFVDKAVNGWWATAIWQVQTGYPFTPTFSGGRSGLNVDGNNVAIVDRPNQNAGRNNSNITSGKSTGCTGVAAGTPLGTINLWYDPCAYTIQPSGFLGNERRNSLLGPNYRDVDFSLVKDTKIKESMSVGFRAEVFNVFNRANFLLPSASVFAGTGPGTSDVEPPINGAGQILGALPARQVQLSLKVLF